MRFLSRIFGGKERAEEAEAPVERECPHVSLVPRWDSAEDIGKSDRVSSYVCEGCKESFSREEGERLQAGEAERVRQLDAERLDKQ
jgi:transposase-like protein